MGDLTFYLFQRVAMLLILAFLVTRISSFRYLLNRKHNWKTAIFHSIIFGVFGIIGTQIGEFIDRGSVVLLSYMSPQIQAETLVGSTVIIIVIAGLFGGPIVGVASGSLTAVYLYTVIGETELAGIFINPIAGLFAGLMARFFSQERIIIPLKAMFIGMFPPIIHMGLLLIFSSQPEKTIVLVNMIGLPLVVINCLGIAIFTSMIRIPLHELEQETAVQTKRALRIAEEALPYLRQGLNFDTASNISSVLHNELKMSAVSITDKHQVLAHIGLGADHHRKGNLLKNQLSLMAIESGEIQIARNTEEIQCFHSNCPLQAVILVPIRQSGEVVGLIKLYFHRPEQIRAVEFAIAEGLGKLISNQLDVVAAEKMKSLLREMELRNLQAQIHPHFLFNTLHLISTLIRVNPTLARHVTVQLGKFMRMNLKAAAPPLILLEQEVEHLNSYMEILKVRFADQLTMECHVAEGTQKAFIPPFTLQPLVENSIKHGLKHVSDGGKIIVNIQKIEQEVELEIRDNGTGVPNEWINILGIEPIQSEEGNGIGLYNVNQRLIGLLGLNSSLKIQNLPTGGCSILFRIPI